MSQFEQNKIKFLVFFCKLSILLATCFCGDKYPEREEREENEEGVIQRRQGPGASSVVFILQVLETGQ